jgi:hypothetical protein
VGLSSYINHAPQDQNKYKGAAGVAPGECWRSTMKTASFYTLTATLSALIALALPAQAGELVAYDGKDTIYLTEAPCASQTVLSHVPDDVKPEFMKANVVLHGEKFTACWRITPTAAHLVYEDGDQGLVPLSLLETTVEI